MEDTAKRRYSDWEVFSGINDALRLVAEENAKTNGPLFRKRAALTLDADTESAELPEDFVREIKAFDEEGVELLNVHNDAPLPGEFSVKGVSLRALATRPKKSAALRPRPKPSVSRVGDTVTLWYFSYPQAVKTPEDEIELPASMAVPVAKIACECVKNANDKAAETSAFFYGAQQGAKQ